MRMASCAMLVGLAGLTAMPAPSHAAGLFDFLFGGGVRKTQRPVDRFPEQPRAPARKRVASPALRISAPTYYDYKPDALVRVKFSLLTDAVQPAAFQPNDSAQAFRDALSGLEDYALLAEADIAKALTDYYAQNPRFIWVENGVPNARAESALKELAAAGGYGLDPADYAVAAPSTADDAMRFEMALSARVLRYVHDATMGRVDPNRISGYHDLPPKPLDYAGTLKTLAASNDVAAFLEAQHPQNGEYQALRTELAALRQAEDDTVLIDPKLVLKPGQSSPELPKLIGLILRDLDDDLGGEFGELLWQHRDSEVYDKSLVPAIKAVQIREGQRGDGVVGPRTVAALAGEPKADRLDKVVLALEELRWLPSDLGSTRVFVNQPAFTASYIEGGAEKLSMRVVVGGPNTQTAFFYDHIKQVDYNPYWGVPQSIIVNEMLPRLMRDPGYLDRAGYEVTDVHGKRIRSSSVSWGAYGTKIPFNVRQIPSEDNALGELKILFPNKHAIYMHDTPSKELFKRDMRALSHGCVRLQNPRGMAAAVLGTSIDYVAAKLKNGHSTEDVTRNIPVYMAYFTAWPKMDGTVEYFSDVYDRDSHLQTALDKTEAVRRPQA